MDRQKVRKLLLLISFAAFPITVVWLAPAPPLMSLKSGVINISVIVILAVIISGFFFRRSFCGWLCPGGGCQLVSSSLNDKRIQNQKLNWFRISMVVGWIIAMILTFIKGGKIPILDIGNPGAGKFAASNIRYFLPYIPVVLFVFLFVSLFGRRGFCNRGCWIYPLLAFTTKAGRTMKTPSLYVKITDNKSCTNCKICTKKCPMSIDVAENVQLFNKLPNHCIQCGICIDVCKKNVFSFSFGIEK
jgi:polyferredoxin